jgi:hypothetical protein
MNASRFYESHREDALAKQIAAKKYSTFVAMPFRDTFSYRSEEVYRDIIQKAAEIANKHKTAKLEFDVPWRADDTPGQAVVITDEIVLRILESHFFVGDATFQNAGVILEAGIALGLKPNHQIILITQGKFEEIHFDLKIVNHIFYRDSGVVDELAKAMIAAATAFEKDADKYVNSVVKSLSESAIQCLRWRGQKMGKNETTSLNSACAAHIFKSHTASEAILLFQAATQELVQRKLIEMYFIKESGKELRGMYPTKLGEAVIRRLWPVFFTKPSV